MLAKRILVSTDLSETSLEVVRAAQARAEATGAVLAVCHVVPELHSSSAFFPQLNQAAALDSANFDQSVREATQRFVAQALPGANLELFVEQGAAASEIVRRAEAWNADLIVTGTQTRGLERALLGSVASQILRYAHCPVLVSRPANGTGGILAATDLSDPSLPAITAAAEESRRTGGALTVLHVLDPSWTALGAAAGLPFGIVAPQPSAELQAEVRAAAVSTLAQVMERSGAQGQAVALAGSPVSTIVDHARERDVALIVVGTRGRTGLSRILLGSVAERVVADAHCSVLAVRHASV